MSFAGASFIPNPTFLDSAVVRHVVTPKGERVIEAAVELAPKRTEHLADSIAGEWVHRDDGKLIYRITAHDFKAHWTEFGTIYEAPEPFLAPAVVEVIGNLH